MFQAYLISCVATGRNYVGVTGRPLAKRWAEHVYDSTRRQTALARAIAKHGRHNFTIEALCSFRTWADACAVEDWLIQQCGTMVPNGYNVMPGGRGRGIGFKPSPESVERSAAKHRGRPCHDNTRAAAFARKGQKKPLGHGVKVAAALRGVPRSKETKAKLSEYWAARRANGEFKTTAPYANHSKSTARKAASAAIAKIPLVLARHIAKCWFPLQESS